jgi:hypothetical protein
MNIRIFDPSGIKAEDYRHRYPALEREPCFDNLSAKALIFVWHYANQSSPLVLYTHDDYERVQEALKRSGFNPSKTERERILSLQWDSQMAIAIRKMSEFDPGARFYAYRMIKKIYDQYQEIIDLGPKAFISKETTGKGEDAVTIEQVDYKRYVDVSAKIADELPGLLTKLEEGFAIVNISGEEIKEDESTALRDWQQKRAGE